jgi:hypothetical protein
MHDEKDVCADLRRVRDELGRTPTYTEYNELGEFSTGPVVRMGDGKWNDGLRECGLKPHKRYDLTAEEAREELLSIASEVNGTPSTNVFNEKSNHRHVTIMSKLGVNSWRDACDEVGLEPFDDPHSHVDDAISDTEELVRLYKREELTTQELAAKYNCTPHAVSWRLEEAGVEVRPPGYRAVYCDLLDRYVGSRTEHDFVTGLNEAGLLDEAVYHPEAVRLDERRWEPDFQVGNWLVECKQGTWGGEYSQAPVMRNCERSILVYGLERDIEALPHDKSIVRIPGEVPDLSRIDWS